MSDSTPRNEDTSLSVVDPPTDEELLELLTPELRAGVLGGTLRIWGPGQNPLKPVVMDLKGRVVKGSGRFPNANDAAVVGTASAWKRSGTYQEALETFVTRYKAEAAEGKTSLEEIMEVAARIVRGWEEKEVRRHK